MFALQDVSKSFGNHQVLQPTTVGFEPFRSTVLIGPSGCGKSTLLRMLVGLIEPDCGTIEFDVTDLYSTDAEIEYYRLRVLEDDLSYFPTYYAVVLMRDDLAKRFPKAVESVLKIQGIIDSTAMAKMSARVRLDHHLESNVAAEYVNEKLGFSFLERRVVSPGLVKRK